MPIFILNPLTQCYSFKCLQYNRYGVLYFRVFNVDVKLVLFSLPLEL